MSITTVPYILGLIEKWSDLVGAVETKFVGYIQLPRSALHARHLALWHHQVPGGDFAVYISFLLEIRKIFRRRNRESLHGSPWSRLGKWLPGWGYWTHSGRAEGTCHRCNLSSAACSPTGALVSVGKQRLVDILSRCRDFDRNNGVGASKCRRRCGSDAPLGANVSLQWQLERCRHLRNGKYT